MFRLLKAPAIGGPKLAENGDGEDLRTSSEQEVNEDVIVYKKNG